MSKSQLQYVQEVGGCLGCVNNWLWLCFSSACSPLFPDLLLITCSSFQKLGQLSFLLGFFLSRGETSDDQGFSVVTEVGSLNGDKRLPSLAINLEGKVTNGRHGSGNLSRAGPPNSVRQASAWRNKPMAFSHTDLYATL